MALVTGGQVGLPGLVGLEVRGLVPVTELVGGPGLVVEQGRVLVTRLDGCREELSGLLEFAGLEGSLACLPDALSGLAALGELRQGRRTDHEDDGKPKDFHDAPWSDVCDLSCADHLSTHKIRRQMI